MRPIVVFLFLLVWPALAVAQDSTVTITGRLRKALDQEIHLSHGDYYRPDLLKVHARLDAQGRFSLTFPWRREGLVNFRVNNTPFPLWLKPGDLLTLTADANRFSETVRFTGPTAGLNQYLADDYATFRAAAPHAAVADWPPARAGAWFDSTHTSRRAFFHAAFPGPPTAYDQALRAWQAADIAYNWAVERLSYATQYAKRHPSALRPTDPYFDFMRDPALRLTNEAMAPLKSYRLFYSRCLDYLVMRKNGSLTAPITRLALYRVMEQQLPAASHPDQLYTLTMEAIARAEVTADSIYAIARADPRLPEDRQAKLRQTWEYYQKNPNAPGRPAPDIRFPTPNGQQLKLSDLRGKVVYLHFWDALSKRSADELAAARALAAALRNQPKVVMLELAINAQENAWRQAMQNQGFAVVDGWSVTEPPVPAAQAFGLLNWQHDRYFLIGPDGVMLDINAPQPADARPAIEAALKRPKP